MAVDLLIGSVISLLASEAGQAGLKKLLARKGVTLAELTALRTRIEKRQIPPPTRPK